MVPSGSGRYNQRWIYFGDQLIVGPYLLGNVSRAPNPRQPTAHVLLEGNDRRSKVLIGGCVHARRQRMVDNPFADLENVQVIRVK